MEDSEELKKLLKQNLEISRESNRILKRLYRAKKWALTFKILYWAVIVLAVLGAYYYVQPVVNSFSDSINKIKDDAATISERTKAIKDIPGNAIEKVQNAF